MWALGAVVNRGVEIGKRHKRELEVKGRGDGGE